MGLFDKLKDGLSRTRKSLAGGFDSVVDAVARRGYLDEDALEELEELLLRADVGVATTEELLAALRDRAKSKRLESADEVRATLRDAVLEILETRVLPDHTAPDGTTAARSAAGDPRVVLVMGVNGTGKTTSIGKLAHRYAAGGSRVLVAASDTFRAAAADQLARWAERAAVEIVRMRPGADPASVAFDAVAAARARDVEVVLVDTAGRLHTKANLMEELMKVRRVLARAVPGAPHESLLVLDATTGQNALVQARQFAAHVGVDGIILAKIDGTAKGGIVIGIARELGIPVRYLGVGEGIEDLVPFDAAEFTEALFAPAAAEA